MKRPPAFRRRGPSRFPIVPVERLETRRLLAAAASSFGQLPLSFEANRGQTAAQVQFLARGAGSSLFITPTSATLSLSSSATSGTALRMDLIGASATPQAVGLDALPGATSDLTGARPVANIATYGRVEERGVYPGVDVAYYGTQQQLEYDFTVAAGADPGVIELSFRGQQAATLDPSGDLVLHTASSGDVIEHAPVLYQTVGGVRQAVAGRYVLTGSGQVSFAVGSYNHGLPLTIDPVVAYAAQSGDVAAIAVDASGSAYITGTAGSGRYPTTPGAFETTGTATTTGFVAKLNPAGTGVVYSTFIDGTGAGIAVDAAGNAYVTGTTVSTTFPTTAGAFQPGPGAAGSTVGDAFVLKLNPAGSGLVYASYLGGSYNDQAHAIAIDAAGDAYVTGTTESTNFPTTAGAFQPATQGEDSAFVAAINPAGSALIYSTYLGGVNSSLVTESGNGIAVDAAGDAYVTGETDSQSGFPVTPGAYDAASGAGFVTKLNPTGTALVYSTHLGVTAGTGIAIDAAGDAYVTGSTAAASFATTPGAFQPTFDGDLAAFVLKLNPGGTAAVYATFLGAPATSQQPGYTMGTGIAIDAAGDAYFVGTTYGTTFPVADPLVAAPVFVSPPSPDAPPTPYAVTAKLDPSGSALVYSTYLSNLVTSVGSGIAVGIAGNASIAGGPGVEKLMPGVAFAAPTFSVNTTAASAVVTVTRSAADAGGAATVDFATADGSAVAGVDYQAVRQTLTFGVGVTSQQVTIPLLDHATTPVAARTVVLRLSNPTGNLIVGPQATAVLAIDQGNPAATATTLTATASPARITYDQPVTLQAAIAGPAGSTGTPGGSVTFLDGTTTLGTVAVGGAGVAFFTPAPLAVGTHSFTAVYSGDAAFAASLGTTGVTVNPISTTLTVAAPSSQGVGQPFAVRIVATDAQGNSLATGTVSLYNLGLIGTYAIVNGSVDVSVTIPTVGTYSLVATYSPPATTAGSAPTHAAGISDPAAVAVVPVLTAAPTAVTVGQPVTFTALLATADPTGSLATTFMRSAINFTVDGTTYLNAPTVIETADHRVSATLTVPSLSFGTHQVAAFSQSNGVSDRLFSNTVTVTVGASATSTTTTLFASTNPSTPGAPVVFTATITRDDQAAGNPTGTVTFNPFGTPIVVAVVPFGTSQATAQIVLSNLPVGMTGFLAAYSGDATSDPSSASILETVAKAAPIVEIAQSAEYAAPGQPVTYTVNVTTPTAAAGTPTGTVTFTIYNGPGFAFPVGATVTVALVPSPTVPGLATATYTASALSPGPQLAAAAYSGDSSFAAGATSIGLVADPAAAPSTTALFASANPSVAGQPVVFTAIVTSAGVVLDPTSTVTFTVDGVAQAPVALTLAPTSVLLGTAQFLTAALAVGPHVITAAFSGSATVAGSSAAALDLQTADVPPAQPVERVASTVGVSTTSGPLVAGQPFVIIATVITENGLSGTPTGTVTFFDVGTGATLGSIPVDANAQAVFFIPALAAGPLEIGVIYSGDAGTFPGSGSTPVLIAADLTPPTVAGVVRSGTLNAPSVVIDFVGPLDPVSAQTVGNYRVLTPAGQRLKVKSATYDATLGTVTLRLASRLNVRATYDLRLNAASPAGIHGANGQSLTGPGTTSRVAIARPSPVATKAVARAIAPHPRGHLAAQHHAASRTAPARSAR